MHLAASQPGALVFRHEGVAVGDPDAAPAVTTTGPADAATGVAVDATITVSFNEAVNATTGSFEIRCPSTSTTATHPFALGSSPATSFTLNPDADLPGGTTCRVTVLASQITDADAADPPNQMAADFSFSFTTTDGAPAVSSNLPLDNATGIPIDRDITVTFNENVTATTGSFTLECPDGTAKTFAVSGSGTATITLNPDADLPAGTTYEVTVLANQISDSDIADPPDNLAANHTFSFTTDAQASVTTASPTDGTIDVPVGTNIEITFSEQMNATTGSFTIKCPSSGAALGYGLSSSPATTFTLNPADLAFQPVRFLRAPGSCRQPRRAGRDGLERDAPVYPACRPGATGRCAASGHRGPS